MTAVKRHSIKGKVPFRTGLFIFCLVFIPLLSFLVYGVYCNIGGLFLSFQSFSLEKERVVWVGPENYIRFFNVFEKFNYGKMIKVSLGYFLVVFFLSTPISLIVGYFLYKKIPFSKLMVVLLFLPNIIPMSLLGEYYRQLYDPKTGILNFLFNSLLGFTAETAPSYLSDPKYANIMLYIYTVWFGFGYNSLLIWGAMSRIPEELVESAKLDGCNGIREFFHIIIPQIWPTLSMLLVLSLMVPFQVYMQPLIIAFDGQAETTTIALLTIQQIEGDPYYSAAISVMMACVSLPLVLVFRKIANLFFRTDK